MAVSGMLPPELEETVRAKFEHPEDAVFWLNLAEAAYAATPEEWESRKANPPWFVCPVCGDVGRKHPSWAGRTDTPTCSKSCSARFAGARRSEEAEAGKDTAEYESRAARRERGKKRQSGRTFPFRTGDTVYVKCPDEFASMARNTDGGVAEHRLAMARKLGRSLATEETVVFVDGNRKNLSPENLDVKVRNRRK